MTTYSVVGPTYYLQAANATPTVISITGGVTTIKIDNVNNSSVDAFVNYSTANTVTASIANATSTGQGICVQHNSTEYIQVDAPYGPQQIIYLVAAAASNANLYVTPVAIIGQTYGN